MMSFDNTHEIDNLICPQCGGVVSLSFRERPGSLKVLKLKCEGDCKFSKYEEGELLEDAIDVIQEREEFDA